MPGKMKTKLTYITLVLAVLFLTSCGGDPKPEVVETINTFTLKSPVAGVEVNEANVDLEWNSTKTSEGRAVTYTVNITGPNGKKVNEEVKTTSFNLNLSQPGEYKWNVTATLDKLPPVSTSVETFEYVQQSTNTPPPVSELTYPENNANNIPTDCTFTWSRELDNEGDKLTYTLYYKYQGEDWTEVETKENSHKVTLGYTETVIWKVKTSDGTDEVETKEYTFTTQKENTASTWTDARDGNVYKTVTIAGKTWLAENFRYLPEIHSTKGEGWWSADEPRYHIAYSLSSDVNEVKTMSEYGVYGVLYNRVASEQVVPAGWHLPTDEEWKELELAMGISQDDIDKGFNDFGMTYRGGNVDSKIKKEGYWSEQSVNDEFGFGAVPGGVCNSGIYSFEENAFYWTSTKSGDNDENIIRGMSTHPEERGVLRQVRYSGDRPSISLRLVKNN
jgi:uncharacterized protein (TIGR02145 family)